MQRFINVRLFCANQTTKRYINEGRPDYRIRMCSDSLNTIHIQLICIPTQFHTGAALIEGLLLIGVLIQKHQFYCIMYHDFVRQLQHYQHTYANLAREYKNHSVTFRPKSELLQLLNSIMDTHYELLNEVRHWKNEPWYNMICRHYSDVSSPHMARIETERRIGAMSVNINYGFTYAREHEFFKREAQNFKNSIKAWEKEVEKQQEKQRHEQERKRKMEENRRREAEHEAQMRQREYEQQLRQERQKYADLSRQMQRMNINSNQSARVKTLPSNSSGWINHKQWHCKNKHELKVQTIPKDGHKCDICRARIGLWADILRCQTCDFDLCDDCAESKQPNLIDKMFGNFLRPQNCPKGHSMRPVHRQKGNTCDVCKGDMQNQPFLRCQGCDYDVCHTCNRPQTSYQSSKTNSIPSFTSVPTVPSSNSGWQAASKTWYCKNHHTMEHATLQKTHSCNICRDGINAWTTIIRCQACDFDLCNDCSKKKDPGVIAKMYGNYLQAKNCPSGHRMIPVQRQNRNSCDICKENIREEPFLRCFSCNYDMCHSCNGRPQTSYGTTHTTSTSNNTGSGYKLSNGNEWKPNTSSSAGSRLVQCKNGHRCEYIAEVGPYGMNSPYGAFNGLFCDICGAKKMVGGLFHCATCKWDACEECS